ncbi:hypothetical protein O181_051701 [Austropuccinia psidii MF-1]|uniref:Chromo domain-containing protein n=1 Tax=Austropuccinia psidii MF-1 TaxID=1389203 RepID=A0A9Q3E484_9BASI|nr:hypothetical protein [Austropuccinia psidii MF-1]
MSSKALTCPQACWEEFVCEFHFSITYCPGRLDTLPDALSFLEQNEIEESRFFSIKTEVFSDLVDQIQKVVWQGKYYKEILKQLSRGESVSDYNLEPQAKLVLFKDKVVIPRNHELQLDILQKCHDSPLAGHPGQEQTLKLMKRLFDWDGMNQINKDYVSSCQQCSRNKNFHHKKFGLLKPLQIPSVPWNSLSMDFITQLPLSRSFDSILVVLDRFSKMAIFIPTYSEITALDLAQIPISHVFSKHGLPRNIVSDRVWLASKNIKTIRPTNKLSARELGPFEVLKKIGSHAYHLKLPPQCKSVHPVFHVSVLESVKQSTLPNRHQLQPPPVIVEDQEEWEVAHVLDSKVKRGTLWYLVEWKGFNEDPERTTWEPASNFTNSPDLVKDFHTLYPDKPSPNSSRV